MADERNFTNPTQIKNSEICIILPVLNEEENLYPLLKDIRRELSGNRYCVCIIDDGSKDKTLDIISTAIQKRHPIHLIQREKKSHGSQRGSALVEGMQWGLANTNANIFIEIDGDRSHRPEELLQGINVIREKTADVAIASKYVPGSETVGRTFGRRVISYLANFFIGFCLDSKINDYSNGYRFYSRKAAEILAESTINYGSPIYLTEALAIWLRRGMIIKEFPSKYIGRGDGLSKLRWTDIFKAVIAIVEISLRFHFSGFSSKDKTKAKVPYKFRLEYSSWYSKSVFITALFVIFFIISMNWFIQRTINFDEMGLYNPIYMFLHYGEMTYPMHWWPNSMVIHPPEMYFLTALFIMAGMSTFYAFGTLPIILGIICVIAIVTSPFRPSLRCAALLSIPTTFLFLNIEWPGVFVLRPEQALAYAWIAGLIFLESARLENWNTRKLFLGAVLLSLASVMQYFAAPAILGLLIYAFVAYRDLGYRAGRLRLAPLLLGSMIILIPHIFLWVIPNIKDIISITTSINGFNGGIISGIGNHILLYQNYIYFPRTPILVNLIWPVIVFTLLLPLWIWIPFFIYKRTRILSIAMLPMLLFVFVIVHKWMLYCIPELFLFYTVAFGIIFIVIETIVSRTCSRYNIHDLSQSILLITVGICIIVLLLGNPANSQLTYSTNNFHEMDLARASTQDIIGNDSIVGGRALHWYTGGGVYWYDVSPNLQWNAHPVTPDYNEYFNNFDYIVESQGMSESTSNKNHETLGTLYLQDYLSLVGFYFTENHGSSILIFQSQNHTAKDIKGYIYMPNGTFMQFYQNSTGHYGLVNYITADPNRINGFPFSILLLPTGNKYLEKFSVYNNNTQLYLKSVIVEKENMATFISATPNDTILNIVPGEFIYKDARGMMNALKQNDRTIEFLGWDYTTLKKRSHYTTQIKTIQCTSTYNCSSENSIGTIIKNLTPLLKITIENNTFMQKFEPNCYAGSCYTQSINGTLIFTPRTESDHISSKFFTLSSDSSAEQKYFSKITFSTKGINKNVLDDEVIVMQTREFMIASNNLNDRISDDDSSIAVSEILDGNLSIYHEFSMFPEENAVRILLIGLKDQQYLIPEEISVYRKP